MTAPSAELMGGLVRKSAWIRSCRAEPRQEWASTALRSSGDAR